jgi:hypothetical protein
VSDWQVGDLALCVDGTWFDQCGLRFPGPKTGEVHSVTDVTVAPEGFTCIDLEGFGDLGMDARQFRKIRPDEHEDCEPEFVTLLNRIKVEA